MIHRLTVQSLQSTYRFLSQVAMAVLTGVPLCWARITTEILLVFLSRMCYNTQEIILESYQSR